VAAAVAAVSAEPDAVPEDLPRRQPVAPEQAAATLTVRPAYRIELVAAEPLVADPVALSFDEHGRLFVVEMRDYSERRAERLGRIRRLEDTDGDGRFDRATTFAEDLPWPTAVFCWGRGVFVGATPDLLFLEDADDNGIADRRETVFTGFASDFAPYQTNRLNVQALLNSLSWGLDNRIHGSASLSGGKVRPAAQPTAQPVDLRGRDFSFDPRTRSLRAESGGGQHGLSFDNAGRKFVCSNSDHLQLVHYEARYADRNPNYTPPNPRLNIAVDGPAAAVFRLSGEEPWRLMRTRWRVAGLVPGPIEGGGRASGYFTAATGVTIYRGNAWPAADHGDVLIADCGSNLIHRKKLSRTGMSWSAARASDETHREFVASTDNWFRPVQFANGPDGALYVLDMYREVIEHPWSLPPGIKRHLDLHNGADRGRIFRLVPNGFQQPPQPRLASASNTDLVRALEHANGWHRDTAARLLYQRNDKSLAGTIERLLVESSFPLGRLHALYALDGLEVLSDAHLLHGLSDPASDVRRHAVRLAEHRLREQQVSEPLWTALERLTDDPDPEVRLQLAFTLGEIRHSRRIQALARLGARDAEELWARVAILTSVGAEAWALFQSLLPSPTAPCGAGLRTLLTELAAQLAPAPDPARTQALLDSVRTAGDARLTLAIAGRLGTTPGMPPGVAALFVQSRSWRELTSSALALAADSSAEESLRIEAIRFLGLTRPAGATSPLRTALDVRQPPAVQHAATQALLEFPDAAATELILAAWERFAPDTRALAATAVLAKRDSIIPFLEAVRAGRLTTTDVPIDRLPSLRAHPDPRVRTLTRELFPEALARERDAVVRDYQSALGLRGDPSSGARIFEARCAACHRVGGLGVALGPDLASTRANSPEQVLTSILDPNRDVPPAHTAYTAETRDGEAYTGLLLADTAGGIVLHQGGGVETRIRRADLLSLKSQGKSLMPDGLEAGLSAQSMADLLAFLRLER
jgi:putative membrane-bound dehydrogenase-like protein